MKEVLLLGDSIRQYTQEKVKELLGEDYHISAPAENCRFSGYTVYMLPEWLQNFPKPDIIHWNNGLWDTSIRYLEDGCFASVEEYVSNLKKILRELRKTGAKIIFATITPCDPKRANYNPHIISRSNNADIERYNKAAVELMKQEGITVNDLYNVVLPNIPTYIRQDDLIHPTELGIQALAEKIATAIKNA